MIIRAIKSYKRRKKIMRMKDVDLDKAVKIQGTKFDRKRKLSDDTIAELRRRFFAGEEISEISASTGICYSTVRYNVDDAWKKKFNEKRDGAHTGTDHITFEDRVAYKRTLVKERLIRV